MLMLGIANDWRRLRWHIANALLRLAEWQEQRALRSYDDATMRRLRLWAWRVRLEEHVEWPD